MASVSVQSKGAVPAFPFAALSATSGVGSLNRLLWKGYLYDKDLGCYCLGKRHYDPFALRFWEPDGLPFLDPSVPSGINPYIYCLNDPITYTDQTGRFAISSFLIGLGIASGIGALVGGTAYVISEGVSYAANGEWTWSWGQFVGSTLGGALGGALAFVLPTAPAALIGGFTGFTSTALGMALQNQWEGTNHGVDEILAHSIIDGLISSGATAISNAIHIPGLNSGRGSYSAVSKQIITKFRNGTISRVSLNTFSKMLTLNLMGDVFGSTVNGLMDAFAERSWFTKLVFGLSL